MSMSSSSIQKFLVKEYWFTKRDETKFKSAEEAGAKYIQKLWMKGWKERILNEFS
jgi:hypothetical protein